MPRAASKWLISVSVLLSMAALADDVPPDDGEGLQEALRSVDELLDALEAASRWHLATSVDAAGPSYIAADPFYDISFQDNSSLARLGRLHSLSLLTLGELGSAQLFLGVNEDGLLGVHFNAFPRAGEEGLLELARMPYLDDENPEADDGL